MDGGRHQPAAADGNGGAYVNGLCGLELAVAVEAVQLREVSQCERDGHDEEHAQEQGAARRCGG